jgi:hypothetical protein
MREAQPPKKTVPNFDVLGWIQVINALAFAVSQLH